MELQWLFNLGLSAVCGLMGWLGRTAYAAIDDLRVALAAQARDIAAHRVEVARDYATNGDIATINAKLDELLRYMRK